MFSRLTLVNTTHLVQSWEIVAVTVLIFKRRQCKINRFGPPSFTPLTSTVKISSCASHMGVFTSFSLLVFESRSLRRIRSGFSLIFQT